MNKICNRCKVDKPLSSFFRDKNNKTDGHYSICKDCKMASSLKWRDEHRNIYNDTQRRYHAKHYHRMRLQRYKITPEEHAQMLQHQNGVCAICEKAPRGRRPLVVDHKPGTFIVRGLLCYGCNRAIAIFDNPELYTMAVHYLNQTVDHRAAECRHPARIENGAEVRCLKCRQKRNEEAA